MFAQDLIRAIDAQSVSALAALLSVILVVVLLISPGIPEAAKDPART